MMKRFADLNAIDENVSKILMDETKEIIKVSNDSYKLLLKMSGGLAPFIFINLFMVIFLLSTVYCNYLIAQWAYSDPDD